LSRVFQKNPEMLGKNNYIYLRWFQGGKLSISNTRRGKNIAHIEAKGVYSSQLVKNLEANAHLCIKHGVFALNCFHHFPGNSGLHHEFLYSFFRGKT
jgi:hypothetical protein